MLVSAWVQDWELECCGLPLKVGDNWSGALSFFDRTEPIQEGPSEIVFDDEGSVDFSGHVQRDDLTAPIESTSRTAIVCAGPLQVIVFDAVAGDRLRGRGRLWSEMHSVLCPPDDVFIRGVITRIWVISEIYRTTKEPPPDWPEERPLPLAWKLWTGVRRPFATRRIRLADERPIFSVLEGEEPAVEVDELTRLDGPSVVRMDVLLGNPELRI